MITWPGDLTDWYYDLILNIVRTYEGERAQFDYKEVLNATEKCEEHNESICRGVCALANSGGGYLIFGVRDRKHHVANPDDRILGIPYANKDLGKEFANKIQRKMQPPVVFDAATNAIPIPDAEDRAVFVVRILESQLGPHMIISSGAFYKRDGGGNAIPMDYHEVRERILFSATHRSLLDNLRWEQQENIALLCHKSKSGLVTPHHIWIRDLRSQVKLSSGQMYRPSVLSLRQARDVAAFWLIIPTLKQLKSEVLRAAIFSNALAPRTRETEDLEGTTEYTVLRSALSGIDQARNLALNLTDDVHMTHYAELSEAVKQRRRSVPILMHELALLFAMHDRCVDVLCLSVSLLRYCIEPQAGLSMPRLAPISPIEEEIAELQAERVTEADAEQWVTNPMLWHMLTGEGEVSQADFQAAMSLVPELGRVFESDIQKRVLEFKRREAKEGTEAAVAWLAMSQFDLGNPSQASS